jgi:hypothetical protein
MTGKGRACLVVLVLGLAACAAGREPEAAAPESQAAVERQAGAATPTQAVGMQQAPTSSPQNVLVTNTTSQPVPVVAATPLPVSGSVGVSGPVEVNGTVGISGTPNVNVTSPVSIGGPVTVVGAVTALQGTSPWTVQVPSGSTMPVSGNVTAAVTGNVNATVTGAVAITNMPSVSLSGGSVTVGNAATSPVLVRDVDAAGAASSSIVYASVNQTVAASVSGAADVIYTVPAGSRLIIDHLSATTRTASGQDLYFQLGSGGNVQNFFPTVYDTSVYSLYGMSQHVHLVFDAGTAIYVASNRSVGGGLPGPALFVSFNLSGRLVPAT